MVGGKGLGERALEASQKPQVLAEGLSTAIKSPQESPRPSLRFSPLFCKGPAKGPSAAGEFLLLKHTGSLSSNRDCPYIYHFFACTTSWGPLIQGGPSLPKPSPPGPWGAWGAERGPLSVHFSYTSRTDGTPAPRSRLPSSFQRLGPKCREGLGRLERTDCGARRPEGLQHPN